MPIIKSLEIRMGVANLDHLLDSSLTYHFLPLTSPMTAAINYVTSVNSGCPHLTDTARSAENAPVRMAWHTSTVTFVRGVWSLHLYTVRNVNGVARRKDMFAALLLNHRWGTLDVWNLFIFLIFKWILPCGKILFWYFVVYFVTVLLYLQWKRPQEIGMSRK